MYTLNYTSAMCDLKSYYTRFCERFHDNVTFLTFCLQLSLMTRFDSFAAENLLCGPAKEIKLAARGEGSAKSLILPSGEMYNNVTKPCTLNIHAPFAYALSLQIIESENPFRGIDTIFDEVSWGSRRKNKVGGNSNKNNSIPNCTLNVFYIDKNEPEALPVWRVAPCSPGFSIKKSAQQLMSPPIRIEWWPSAWSKRTDRLRLVVTAVNSGQRCLEKDQITCLRAGSEALLCVSIALACDDVKHCPTGNGGDEASSLCSNQKLNWFERLLKIINSKHGEILGVDVITSRPTNEITSKSITESTHEKGKSRKGLSALDAALEPYGTWGYLMLGMLICAVVLIIFGVWECFCHYSRAQDQTVPPDCIAPAAICSSHPQHWRPYPPPDYDEVEPPPPSYSALFPSSDKITETPGTSQEEQVSNVQTV